MFRKQYLLYAYECKGVNIFIFEQAYIMAQINIVHGEYVQKAFHHIDVYEVYESIAFNSLQYMKVIAVKNSL